MAITQLNNVLVKHGKIMFGIITAIIIVAFVWFFTPGADGSILFGTNPNSPDAACGDVAGTPVTNKDVNNVIKAITLFRAVQMNQAPDQTRVNVSFDEAFPAAAMYKAAQKLGVVVPDDEVAKLLRSLPAFQKDGKFNAEAYIAYEKNQLQPAGFNAKDLEEAIRLLLTADTLPQLLGSSIVAPAELEESFKNDLTSTEALNIVFKTEDFKKQVKPTEKDLQAYYNANKGLFMAPEKYKADAVAFRFSDYKINEKNIKAFYDKNKKTLINPADGKPMTYAAFKADYVKQEQMKLAQKDAREFREKIYEATKLIAGDKKAYLKEYQKIAAGAKAKRVAINWFDALSTELSGIGADRALMSALLTKAKETSPVTDPVLSDKAVYVAAITETKPAAQLTYAAAKARVNESYIAQKAAAKTKEAMANFRAALAQAKKAKQVIDEKKIKALAKGAQVTAVPAKKLADFKKGIQQIKQQIQNISNSKMAPEAMNNAVMQGQFQMQILMMQLQQAMPIIETSAGALSKESATAEGISVYYVTKRTLPKAADIAANKAMLTEWQIDEKQQLRTSGLYDWLGKNTKNYIQLQQQQQEQQQK